MKKVRILQVGYKHDHGKLTFDRLLMLSDLFEVVGLADENIEAAKEAIKNAPAYYTIEEALALDFDAVTIECEEEKATKYALMFAEKGVHVHLDKPGSQNIEDFNRLADSLKEKNLVFHLGYMYRYNPAIKDSIRMAKNGELGEIFSVEAHMSVRHPQEKREWLGKFKGGMMYFLGCHLIDLVLQICGTPEEIIPMNCATGIDGVKAEDFGFVVFKYKNGISFVKTCAEELNGFARRQLVITGSKGTIELKPLEAYFSGSSIYTAASTVLESNAPRSWCDDATKTKTEPFDRYGVMMEHFAMCVMGKPENQYTYDYEKQLFEILMKCCNFIK